MVTLNTLQIGDKATILKIEDSDIAVKLTEMGLLAGETIEIERKAPWGGPITINTEDYSVSMRLAEAATITVEKL